MGSASNLLSQIVSDAANVGTLGASNLKLTIRCLELSDLKIVDMDQSWRSLDFDAFSGQLVKRNTVFLDRRDMGGVCI